MRYPGLFLMGLGAVIGAMLLLNPHSPDNVLISALLTAIHAGLELIVFSKSRA
jgi:hypothetical protein